MLTERLNNTINKKTIIVTSCETIQSNHTKGQNYFNARSNNSYA